MICIPHTQTLFRTHVHVLLKRRVRNQFLKTYSATIKLSPKGSQLTKAVINKMQRGKMLL